MALRADPEKSRDFNRTLVLSALLAGILAVLLLGLYYGCARSSRPERPSATPPPSGMVIFQNLELAGLWLIANC
jgi:hypothetical protein